MHVAITGASSGIGEALVREYARRGAAVTLVARRSELLERIAREVGGKTHRAAVDLSDVGGACDWIGPAEAALGPIDVLVNNAGLEIVAPTTSVDWARAEDLLAVNVRAPLKIAHAVLPRMIARGQGTIVNVASVAALAPLPGSFFYGASKAALANASECLRAEVRRTGVHVLTVYPGPVHTPMGDRANESFDDTLLKRLTPWGTPEVLARRVARAVERRKARVIYPRFYTSARWLQPLARRVSELAPLRRDGARA